MPNDAPSLRALPVLLAVWAVTGLGAVIGSILGNAFGSRGLFLGAVVGGIVGVAVAVVVAGRVRWLPRGDRLGAFVGGVVGFVVAAPIAVANLHTPITPALTCGLAGAGALLGVGVARGWARRA